jgi:hypothetical protein
MFTAENAQTRKGWLTSGGTLGIVSFLIRSIAIINIALLIVDEKFPAYTGFFRHGVIGKVVILWLIATSFLLPLLGGFQARRAISDRTFRNAAIVDATLATTWCAVFWLTVLYSFTHTAMI